MSNGYKGRFLYHKQDHGQAVHMSILVKSTNELREGKTNNFVVKWAMKT